MPISERDYMYEAPTEELPAVSVHPPRRRLDWYRLGLWIVVSVALALGGVAADALAWTFALILFVAVVLGVGLLMVRWVWRSST